MRGIPRHCEPSWPMSLRRADLQIGLGLGLRRAINPQVHLQVVICIQVELCHLLLRI